MDGFSSGPARYNHSLILSAVSCVLNGCQKYRYYPFEGFGGRMAVNRFRKGFVRWGRFGLVLLILLAAVVSPSLISRGNTPCFPIQFSAPASPGPPAPARPGGRLARSRLGTAVAVCVPRAAARPGDAGSASVDHQFECGCLSPVGARGILPAFGLPDPVVERPDPGAG